MNGETERQRDKDKIAAKRFQLLHKQSSKGKQNLGQRVLKYGQIDRETEKQQDKHKEKR
jgi:hypothetical protein